MRPISAPASDLASTSPAATPAVALSPWHSPVPYLFSGLAAMMGLIALALLILACSHWKLNNYLGNGRAPSSSSSSSGAADGDGSKSPAAAALADLVAVVMAGEKMPTFLAAPIVRRAVADSAAVGELSSEMEDAANRGKAEGGEVAGPGGERSRSQQVDHV